MAAVTDPVARAQRRPLDLAAIPERAAAWFTSDAFASQAVLSTLQLVDTQGVANGIVCTVAVAAGPASRRKPRQRQQPRARTRWRAAQPVSALALRMSRGCKAKDSFNDGNSLQLLVLVFKDQVFFVELDLVAVVVVEKAVLALVDVALLQDELFSVVPN